MALPALLTGILTGGGSWIGGKLAGRISRWFKKKFGKDLTEEEVQELEQEIQLDINNLINRISEVTEHEVAEITRRHRTDMKSDSVMSKNIRPGAFAYLLVFFTGVATIDAALDTFTMPVAIYEQVGTWIMLIIGFYFGGRSAEKLTEIYASHKFGVEAPTKAARFQDVLTT